MLKKKSPAGIMGGAMIGLGSWVAAFPHLTIPQREPDVNGDFDRVLSVELDRAIERAENARGISGWMWQMRKQMLERRIPLGETRGEA